MQRVRYPLASMLVFSLAAGCGADSPAVGVWAAADGVNKVELSPGGTAHVDVETGHVHGKWTVEGDAVTIETDSMSIKGSFNATEMRLTFGTKEIVYEKQ